jgi:hypothetical protein
MTKKALMTASAIVFLAGGLAVAQQSTSGLMTSIPADATTVTNYYKQNVYDPSDNKIGDITDVLVQKDGKIPAVIIGVGGFLGMGEKDVAVSFDAVKQTTKKDKIYLVLNTTKDALKSAPGFRYDRATTKWVPETAPATKTQ